MIFGHRKHGDFHSVNIDYLAKTANSNATQVLSTCTVMHKLSYSKIIYMCTSERMSAATVMQNRHFLSALLRAL